ncbi:hypothetical protein P0Y35_06105 [Kiritimatiellaeota bacterium B1221]|nr:hypothetical protein [Kiritimatiellaeota bacterium B1221]
MQRKRYFTLWTVLFSMLHSYGAEEEAYRLEHRLKPGEVLRVSVQTDDVLHPVPREVLGVSAHRLGGWTGLPYNREGGYTLTAAYEEAVRDLRLPMTRFYAVGVEAFGVEAAIDRAADMAKSWGIPEEHVVLELEVQGAREKLTPEVWAAAVRYSVDSGYGFKRWEISNEPWSRPAFPTIESYRDHVVAVSKAIRAEQPRALIGIAMWRAVQYGIWDHHVLLKGAAGHYDWVAPHYYDFLNAYENSFEDVVLAANYKTMTEILANQKLLDTYNPERRVTQYDTEWAHHSPGPDQEGGRYHPRLGNVYGTLHCAVRLIYYARENLVEGAGAWELFAPDDRSMGFISSSDPERRTLRYWLYYYFTRHLGEKVVGIEGVAPWFTATQTGRGSYQGVREFSGPVTPVLATRSEDGRKLFFIVVNGSWDRSFPAEFYVRGDKVRSAKGFSLSQDERDAEVYVEEINELTQPLPLILDAEFDPQNPFVRISGELPPRAVSFITLELQ